MYFAILSLLITRPVLAQSSPAEEAAAEEDTAEEAAADAPLPRLPILILAPPAPYPPQALEERLEGTVMLELRITEEGEVLSATVVQAAGHGFDEAAAMAARSFRFAPALDELGQPAASLVQYEYRFTLELVPTVAVEGLIVQAGTREPREGVQVVLLDEEGVSIEVSTDAEGRFRFVDIAPGAYALAARAPGLAEQVARIAVTEGKVSTVKMFLVPDRAWELGSYDEELVVIGERVDPEIIERSLSADEIRAMPGTGGDIVRAMQSLPGIARSPFNAGQVLVRGTGPDETAFYLGGVALPLVFHFGGLSTVINSDSLQEVSYMPGNYGVRYGRRLGGAIDLKTRKTLPERSSGYLSIDLFQSAAFLDRKIGEHWSVTLSARRSYIDTLLAPVLAQQVAGELKLPRYWDVQARTLWRGDGGSTFDAMALLSDDRFTYTEDSSDGATESEISASFQKVWMQWQKIGRDGWMTELTTSLGPETTLATFRDTDEAYSTSLRSSTRFEVYRDVPEAGWVGWRMGIEADAVRDEFSYDIDELSSDITYTGDESGDATSIYPSIYIEQTQRGGIIEGTPGVRVDAMLVDSGYVALAIDPRLSLTLDTDGSTRFRGSVGRYSQFPLLREVLDSSSGNDNLIPEWSLQSSLGVDHDISTTLTVEVTAYHAWLVDLISGHEDRFTFVLGPPPTAPLDLGNYSNAGTGRAYGVESLVRYESPRLLAWGGLTISRSSRVKRPDLERVLYEYDQPVLFTGVASYKLPRNWQTGLRMRYGSGNPYTPVANRALDLENHIFYPIYDTDNSARMPAYFTLDVRVDRAWIYDRWQLTAYLDLQNATNRRNVEMINWSYDWDEELPIYGLPIIPAFGVRGEW